MKQWTLAPLMRSQCATDSCVLAQLHLQGTPAAVMSYTQFYMHHYNIRSEMLKESSSNKIYYMQTFECGGLLLTSKIKQNQAIFIQH